MASRLWGPWTVIFVFTLAGGLIGEDVALSPWGEEFPAAIPLIAGLLTGLLAGGFIAWFVRQLDELG